MIAYWAILSARFRTLLQYRMAAVAGFGTQVFWGFIRMMIFGAFYASSTAPQPMTWPEVLTYVWLGQAMLMILPLRLDREVEVMVRTGNVVYELVRPMDLYSLWYARSVAARTAPTLLRSVPMFILALLFFGMSPPPSAASFAAWILATLGAVLLGAALTTLLLVLLMWTITGRGTMTLVSACAWMFSGIIIPLPLFPDWAQPLLNILPFRGLMDTPFRLYMGHIPPSEAPWVFAHQLAWTAGMVFFGRWLLGRGMRRPVVQGG
ncbi:MAG: ABC transporter permease [Planctomycetota bacterium]|jgi:ABC-2 type transport system permease protein